MKNLKKIKIKDTSVAYVTGGKTKELKRSYLKGLASYLEATLPPELKLYGIRVVKTIRAVGDKPGGLVAVEGNLRNVVTYMNLYVI